MSREIETPLSNEISVSHMGAPNVTLGGAPVLNEDMSLSETVEAAIEALDGDKRAVGWLQLIREKIDSE